MYLVYTESGRSEFEATGVNSSQHGISIQSKICSSLVQGQAIELIVKGEPDRGARCRVVWVGQQATEQHSQAGLEFLGPLAPLVRPRNRIARYPMSQPLVFPSQERLAEGLLKRRGDRIALDAPISVRGTDAAGEAFGEQTRTVVLSRQGATIVLKRKLAPGSLITIRNLAIGSEAQCRVVAQTGGQADGYLYGVSLLDPTTDLWGIGFPPPSKAKNSAARLLLGCETCHSRELVYMDEMEAQVFASNLCISRFCSVCQQRSTWRDGTLESASSSVPIVIRRTANDRSQPRVPARMRLCIRQTGFGEELVFSENVSRSGFSFKSPSHYHSGSLIQIALPYSQAGGNIFVTARIAHARDLASEGVVYHGAAYVQHA